MFKASVDRLGGSIGGAGAVEIGQHVDVVADGCDETAR